MYMRKIFAVQEAIALLQMTVEPKQETYGDLSAQVASTWKLIGSSYLSIGKTEKALQSLNKVCLCHILENKLFCFKYELYICQVYTK